MLDRSSPPQARHFRPALVLLASLGIAEANKCDLFTAYRWEESTGYVLLTYLNDASSDFCDPFGFCQDWLHQLELTAGVVVRF